MHVFLRLETLTVPAVFGLDIHFLKQPVCPILVLQHLRHCQLLDKQAINCACWILIM